MPDSVYHDTRCCGSHLPRAVEIKESRSFAVTRLGIILRARAFAGARPPVQSFRFISRAQACHARIIPRKLRW